MTQVKPILLDFPESFTTERLLIRAPQPGDGPDLMEGINDSFEKLRPWMPWAKLYEDVRDAEEKVRTGHVDFKARKDLRFHIYTKDAGDFVGCTGFHRIDWSVPRVEIGYWCKVAQQRKGYITEAVEGMTAFAFEHLGAARVEIRLDPENERSKKIPERLGFPLEARLTHWIRLPNGQLRDALVFAKTRETPPPFAAE